MTKPSPVDFTLSAGSFILGALLVLLLPLRLLLAIALAAAAHECGHLLALQFFHIPVLAVRIHGSGILIRTPPLSPLCELLCALAGPAGSFLCLFLSGRFPLLALCALVQGLFNLLPVYPLDGGRALKSAATLLFPHQADSITFVTGLGATAAVCGSLIFLFLRTVDYFFLLAGISFLLKICHPRKTPCKEGAHWVQ